MTARQCCRRSSPARTIQDTHVAIATVTVFPLAVGVPMLLAVGGFNIFAYLGTIAGLCVTIAYILVNVALIVGFRTKDRAEFNLCGT